MNGFNMKGINYREVYMIAIFINFKRMHVYVAVAVCAMAVMLIIGCGGIRGNKITKLDGEPNEINPSTKVFSQTMNSMKDVLSSELRIYYRGPVILDVAGTARGAIAQCIPPGGCWVNYDCESLEVKLDEEDWHTFLNALHNSGIKKWSKDGYLFPKNTEPYWWELDIFIEDGETLFSSKGFDGLPPNWPVFEGVMVGLIDTMKDKVKKRFDTEYTNLFGSPMSDHEHSIKEITYCHGSQRISVWRTTAGTVLFHKNRFDTSGSHVEINLEDWLNLVNVLGNNVINIAENPDLDRVYVNLTEKRRTFSQNMIEPLSVSDEFRRVMDGIHARVVATLEKRNVNVENDDAMVFVQGGTFTMGCTPDQENGCSGETRPAHRVTVGDFYIGKYEVTQRQWKHIMGDDNNPSVFKRNDLPIGGISWNDVQEFITKLNQQVDKKYRLPTEAEWEYAARGGNKSIGYKYSGSNILHKVAWYRDNCIEKNLQPIGTKQPNELGIHDMSGSMGEWVNDWYAGYTNGVKTNPAGPFSGSDRVTRGCDWYSYSGDCLVSERWFADPDERLETIGFRLALSP